MRRPRETQNSSPTRDTFYLTLTFASTLEPAWPSFPTSHHYKIFEVVKFQYDSIDESIYSYIASNEPFQRRNLP